MEWVLNSAVIAENTPLRLSTEQMANPEGTLRSLYKDFTLHDMREILWDVFSRSLAADDDELGFIPDTKCCFVTRKLYKFWRPVASSMENIRNAMSFISFKHDAHAKANEQKGNG
jgi:hypothetical protein